MSALEFLYPVTLAFDCAALAACIVGPILAVKSIDRWGWLRARARVAYLGYFCCALLAASFALHLAVDGGDIFMVFIFWAAPFGIAASVAQLLLAAYVVYPIVVLVVAARRRSEWWDASRSEA